MSPGSFLSPSLVLFFAITFSLLASLFLFLLSLSREWRAASAIVDGYFSFRDPFPDPSRRFKVLLILDFTRPTDPGSDQSLIRDRSRNTLRMFIRGGCARASERTSERVWVGEKERERGVRWEEGSRSRAIPDDTT